MSEKFSGKWEGRGRRFFRTQKPLKPKINYAVSRVEQQVQRINSYVSRYSDRHRTLFEKMVQAYERHDNSRVKVLANELAEIRKQRNLLMNAELSLNNVALRLRTVFEFGNFVSSMSPVVSTLDKIGSKISGILPDVGNELGQVGMRLNDLVIEMGQGTGPTFDFDVANEDAQEIMEEAAAAIGENRAKMKLPDVPTGKSIRERQLTSKREDDTE